MSLAAQHRMGTPSSLQRFHTGPDTRFPPRTTSFKWAILNALLGPPPGKGSWLLQEETPGRDRSLRSAFLTPQPSESAETGMLEDSWGYVSESGATVTDYWASAERKECKTKCIREKFASKRRMDRG